MFLTEPSSRRGGIQLGVNNNLKHISIKVNETNGKEEMKWILINNDRIEIRIGVIYMPQESRTTVQESSEFYKKIANEIEKANQDKHHISVVADFNCKVCNKSMAKTIQ